MIEKVVKPQAITADAAYKTPAIAQFLKENEMTLTLPYTRTRTKDERVFADAKEKHDMRVGQIVDPGDTFFSLP